MFSIRNIHSICIIALLNIFLLFISCSENDTNNIKPATIKFVNHTSYNTDIYKNLNPENFDPARLVCTIKSGSEQKVTMYASADQVLGDTFYIRYKVQLADINKTGTTAIYVDAQRDMSNMRFVIENGKTYTKQIAQPTDGQLKFINGYIKVQNLSSTQIQIQRSNSVLFKLDDNSAYLHNTGSALGYYEINFHLLDTVLNMSQLSAFSGSHINFPAFDMERGKLYFFAVNNLTVTEPVITNIDPLRK